MARQLPANPSQEHLRKQAKRLAATEGLQLAAAQRRLAADYGYPNWAALMAAIRQTRGLLPLAAAAARRDEGAVRELLAAGASPRQAGDDGATALHVAARHGPLTMVELLIRGGALSWMSDRRGRTALDWARAGTAPDRDRIVELLDRPVIRDPRFRAAVQAIHAGDVAALERLLDTYPALLHERAIEPDCYPRDYFRDPKLFWFVANNPTLMAPVPANIVAVAQAMIARGVDEADLVYTLELVMSGADNPEQAALVALLIGAGARASDQAIAMTLAHCQLAPVQALLDRGLALTAPIAAAFGHDAALPALLAETSPEDRQTALGLAVINRRLEAARFCLDAGADPNRYLPVHRHSMPLHQAAFNDDVPMLALLVARGARLDARDTLWNGTPLGWAVHGGKTAAEAWLRGRESVSA